MREFVPLGERIVADAEQEKHFVFRRLFGSDEVRQGARPRGPEERQLAEEVVKLPPAGVELQRYGVRREGAEADVVAGAEQGVGQGGGEGDGPLEAAAAAGVARLGHERLEQDRDVADPRILVLADQEAAGDAGGHLPVDASRTVAVAEVAEAGELLVAALELMGGELAVFNLREQRVDEAPVEEPEAREDQEPVDHGEDTPVREEPGG